MGEIIDKVKEKLTDTKDKVVDTTKGMAEKTENKISQTAQSTADQPSETQTQQDREFEEGAAGSEVRRGDDPLTTYREKEPMTPAKIKEHEPTAVKREMTEKIVEPGQEKVNPDEAAEKARRSGMTKGTAGAGETGSEYEQGAAGSNK